MLDRRLHNTTKVILANHDSTINSSYVDSDAYGRLRRIEISGDIEKLSNNRLEG